MESGEVNGGEELPRNGDATVTVFQAALPFADWVPDWLGTVTQLHPRCG